MSVSSVVNILLRVTKSRDAPILAEDVEVGMAAWLTLALLVAVASGLPCAGLKPLICVACSKAAVSSPRTLTSLAFCHFFYHYLFVVGLKSRLRGKMVNHSGFSEASMSD